VPRWWGPRGGGPTTSRGFRIIVIPSSETNTRSTSSPSLHFRYPDNHVMSHTALKTRLLRAFPARVLWPTQRNFSVLPAFLYDGLYKDLSATKLRKTWLQALAEREAGAKPTLTTHLTEELAPKRMTDSYHKIVSRNQSITKWRKLS